MASAAAMRAAIPPPRRRVWKTLRRDRGAMIGLALLVLVVGMALAAPLAPYGPTDRAKSLEPPGAAHWLGTDLTGYDVFTRLLHGARLSLLTGVAAVLLSLAVGVPVGAVSGYAGGRVDGLVMRAIDVMLAFPSVVLAIAIATLVGAGAEGRGPVWRIVPVIVAAGVVAIPTVARQVRGSVLQVKHFEFVLAARAAGMTPARILVRHVLPNCLAPIIVLATLGVGFAILTAAGLNFLGLGPDATVAEWGVMLKDGYAFTRQKQWVIVPPGLAIAITVLGFNLLGDGLRRAWDPRAR